MHMQTGTVKKANRSSGLITNPEPGKPDILFEREGQHKKVGCGFEPVPEQHRYFPKEGKVVHLVQVEETPDGPKATKWRVM